MYHSNKYKSWLSSKGELYLKNKYEKARIWREKNKEILAEKRKQKRLSLNKTKKVKVLNDLICSRCKIRNVPLVKHCKTKYNQYFYCRDCNASASKKYRSTKNGMKKTRIAIYKSINKYPEKQRARLLLNYKIKNGEIIKPKICQICLKDKKLEGHHSDYSKPLNVMWVCRSCHTML